MLMTRERNQPATASNRSFASNEIEVGVIDPHYNLERVSYGLSAPGFVYRKVRRIPIQKIERRGTFWAYTPLILDRTASLMHTWNMIPLNATRYVMSCEMELPRYLGRVHSWQTRFAQRSLASPACRAVLSLSEIACEQAREKYEELNFPSIREKIEVFRGAIKPSTSSEPRQPHHGPLRVLFVGRDAVRKGLIPTLDAIDGLRRDGIDIQLTVVSKLDVDDNYVFEQFAPDLGKLHQRLSSTPWIRHVTETHNNEVRQMMRDHDLLILPTFDESLGWVMIEAGAEACPSIATNVYAIPELIDDGITGSLLNLPLNQDSRWVGLFMQGNQKRLAIEAANNSLRIQIADALQQANNDRYELAARGNRARAKISALYNHDRASEQLTRIYEHAIC
ncbi:glycosyltransferase family 4 protein [Planctomycetes bacterium K23_9]|uniref:Glycogen synthase n=1 Tax=Stieleria marina TaxID=1930275 RepID=A0A517NNU3_9BACT|nr:Glycogen synthase [Planctomycetes bacterium K23_9]